MAGQGHRRLLTLLLVLAAWALATPAFGEAPPATSTGGDPDSPIRRPGRSATITVRTNELGAVLEAEQTWRGPQQAGTGARPAKAPRRVECRWMPADPAEAGIAQSDPEFGSNIAPAEYTDPSGDHWVLSQRICNGYPTEGVRYLRVRRGTGPKPAPGMSEITEQVRELIAMPGVTIGISPRSVGVTGLESWFWVEGYSGQTISEARRVFGRLVEVEAAPSAYVWDFGDGSSSVVTASLGLPYPRRSEVTHTYWSTNHDPGYTVSVRFILDVRWRVEGGAWLEAAPVERTASTKYLVDEVRSVLVR